MNFPEPRVLAGTCPRCKATVLKAGWDDLEGIRAAIVADPTPLSEPEEVACILGDRNVYVLERTTANTYRLSLLHAYSRDRQVHAPALHLPAHRCHGRFPSVLPMDDLVALFPALKGSLADAPF